MRATIRGIQVEGTPQEVAELIKLVDGVTKIEYVPWYPHPYTPWWQPPVTCDTATTTAATASDVTLTTWNGSQPDDGEEPTAVNS